MQIITEELGPIEHVTIAVDDDACGFDFSAALKREVDAGYKIHLRSRGKSDAPYSWRNQVHCAFSTQKHSPKLLSS